MSEVWEDFEVVEMCGDCDGVGMGNSEGGLWVCPTCDGSGLVDHDCEAGDG